VSTWLNGSIQPQFRTIDGLSIRFAESDDRGDHALLLSPWPESLFAFEPTWARLAERAHLVAIDLPGFGHSQRGDSLLSPRAMGEFIIRAADPLGLRHPDVIASMSAPRQRCSLRPRDPGPAARPGHRQRRPVARSSSAACAEIGGCRSTPSPLTSGCPAALAGSGWAGPGSSSVPSGPTPSEECSEP